MKEKIKPLGRPGFTMFNNYIIDHFMPSLSANGWKVLCVAIRQTWGWADETTESGRKEKDRIAYSQFMEMTGIKSAATLSRAIQENLDKGYLLRERNPAHSQMYDYRLNMDYEIEVETASKNEVVNEEITPSESEEDGQTTALDSEEEESRTSLENEDTKETNFKETIREKKENDSPPENPVPSKLITFKQGDDFFDVVQKCALAGGNYADPAPAGGADSLAAFGLFCLYDKRGKSPPRQGTKEHTQQRERVRDALRAYGYQQAYPDLVEKAAEIHCERKGAWVNVFYKSFVADFGEALQDAEYFLKHGYLPADGDRRKPHGDPEKYDRATAMTLERLGHDGDH